MIQEIYGILLGLVLGLVQLAIGSIAPAAILRKASEWACGTRPTFRQAYVATVLPALIAINPTLLVGAVIGNSPNVKPGIEIGLFLCLSLVFNPLVYSYILRGPSGSRLGMKDAWRVWFYQLLATFFIAGSVVLVAMVIWLMT